MQIIPLLNKEITKKLIDAIQIKGFVPTEYSRVCIPSVFSSKNEILTKGPEAKDGGIMNVYENPIDLSINNSYNDCPITPKTVKRQIIFEHSYCNCPSKELLTTPKRGRPQTVVTPRKNYFGVLKKGFIGGNEHDTLLDEFEGMSKELFKNQMNNQNKKATGQRYSNELKKFALTLNYYSPKAYKYCRIDLFLDAMSIKKQVIWDKKNHKFVGYCDFGGEVSLESSETAATEVLVSELIKTALSLAYQSELRIWGVTCDGPFTNFSTLKLLGCEFGDEFDSIKSWFKNPINGEKVFFIPDACHMIKLARNTILNCLVAVACGQDKLGNFSTEAL
ncbi:THAP domain-containing protein 2-like, partial [Aphis craccivora]